VGTLKLPSSGLVYLDTQAVIYSVETHADYWPLLEPVWQAAEAGSFEIVSSELVLMETTLACCSSGSAHPGCYPCRDLAADGLCSAYHERLRVSSGSRVAAGHSPRRIDARRLI